MGKQIDADKLIEHFINKTPNGWLVPICENESRWTLEGIISEIEYFDPTVEAIPKDQYEQRLKENNELINDLEELRTMINKFAESYETRLKADMVAMLTEIQLEIQEIWDNDPSYIEGLHDSEMVIQQKIDKLKESD